MSEAQTTTEHRRIRTWVEERQGHPATVKGTAGDEEAGLLRIDFGDEDDSLERIDWDTFFQKFDTENLAFLYQDTMEGDELSRFCKFVARPKPR